MVESSTSIQWSENQVQPTSNNQFGVSESAGQRRKTTREKIQGAFAIQNDIINRNYTNKPDGDEFFNFISKFFHFADLR